MHPVYNNNTTNYSQHSSHSYAQQSNSGDFGGVKRSHSLPRHGQMKQQTREQTFSSTMPRQRRGPPSTSTPEPTSEAIVEEERINPDGKQFLYI